MSRNSISEEYTKKGGLHWGVCLRKGLYSYFMATWPFVRLDVTAVHIRITVTNWRRVKEEVFEFEKSDLRSIRRKGGFISAGFVFEHNKSDYPTLIHFFSFKPKRLSHTLIGLGYNLVR